MTLLTTSSARTQRTEKLKQVLIGSLILLVFLFLFSGWNAVLTSPQYAFAMNAPLVNELDVTIDGDRIEKNIVIVHLLKPKNYLRGVNQVAFEIINSHGALWLEFDEQDLMNNKTKTLTPKQVYFYKNKQLVENEFGYCIQNKMYPMIEHFNGNFLTKRFEQGIKKINLQIEVDIHELTIPSELECYGQNVNNGKIIQTTINDLQLNIDVASSVKYRWSSKGANRYEI